MGSVAVGSIMAHSLAHYTKRPGQGEPSRPGLI
jgi:hypothetical protein